MKKTSRKAKPKAKPAGIMRNDLDGSMRVRGNKISVQYKRTEFATGLDNTAIGWKMANEWWAKKLKELQAIEAGEKPVGDTINNVFDRFLDYKKKITKITKKTEQYYWTGYKAIISSPNEILTEANVKKQIDNFVRNATVSANTINIYLRAIAGFLNWASDEDNNYIPAKNYTKKYKQKETDSVKPPYTADEYNLLLEYFEHRNYEMWLLLQFLWNTGARCGETLAIKLDDIDLENSCILVPNKLYKGEQETLLLLPAAVKIVEQAIDFAAVRGDGKLFSWKETKLPNKIMRRAENNLQIKKDGRGLHGFRRALFTL
jgi:integrase